MELLVTRMFQEKGKATIGHLYINGTYECFTLEPAAEDPAHVGHPCIPAGKYKVGLRDSKRFGPNTIEILKVPERTDILVHAGNEARDSLGCMLVGYTHTNGAWQIHRSRDALKAVKEKVVGAIRDNAAVWIEVVDSFKAGKLVA